MKVNAVVAERELANLKDQMNPIWPMMSDDSVTEIMANPNGKVFIHADGKTSGTDIVLDYEEREMIICFAASMCGQVVDEQSPGFDGTLLIPNIQARISAIMPPWTEAPSFCIRKLSNKVIPLSSYLVTGRGSKEQVKKITSSILYRKNILISGGTGSGKTTLVKAMIHTLLQQNKKERIYIVEDTREINCTGINVVSIRVDPKDSPMAVARALRYFPDRIVFGEVRYGAVLLELLKAWNTGHPGGITTIHADSAEMANERAEDLLCEVLLDPVRRGSLLRGAIDVIVHLSRGGKIEKIMEKK